VNERPSFEVLDRNLAALLSRAYVPVLPRTAFRAEMRELARAEADERRRRGGRLQGGESRRSSLLRVAFVAVPLAAAALLLMWFAVSRLGGDGASGDGGRGPTIVDNDGGAPPSPGDLPGAADRSGDPDARDTTELTAPDERVADGERRGVSPGDGSGDGSKDASDGAQDELAAGDGADEAETAALEGVVTGPDGEPVTRFRVALLPDREVPEVAMPIVREFEAEDGAFRWDGVAPDRYEIFVEADGLAQDRRGPLSVDASGLSGLVVALQRGRPMRGWVVDDATDAPLVGATVVVETETPSKVLPFDLSSPPSWVTRFARTGSDGGFALEDLSPGAHLLRVVAPGFAPKWVSIDVASVGPDESAPAAAVPQRIVRLGTGGAVRGAVTDSRGQPLAGSVVLATFADDPSLTRLFSFEEARTDARGEFEFDHLAPGLYMMVQWDSEALYRGGGAPTLRPAFVSAGETARVDFRGEAVTTRVVGRLTDAQGEPLPHQKLTLLPVAANDVDGTEDWIAGASDGEGRFAFAIESPGRHLLFATFGMGERLTLVHEFLVHADETEHVEDVRLPATRATVAVVRALDGTAVPGAALTVLRVTDDDGPTFAGRAMTDADGLAELAGLTPGRYLIVAESLGDVELGQGASDVIELRADTAGDAGATPTRIELPLGGALSVRVRAANGAPLAGATVRVRVANGPEYVPFLEPRTGADGRVVVSGLAPATYAIRVTLAGFEPFSSEIDVRPVLGGEIDATLLPESQD